MKTLHILPDESVKEVYEELARVHNLEVETNLYANSGFDLPLADNLDNVMIVGVHKEDYRIKCAMYGETQTPSAFYLYPRSSISKTPLRLANNVGIIDAGYRGHLIGMFDLVYQPTYNIKELDRYLQICAPGLVPILVELVNSVDELGNKTERGAGGFGSTGR